MNIGVPPQTQRALEARPVASSTLTDTDCLGRAREHLTGTTTGEADDTSEIGGLHRPAMNFEAGDPFALQDIEPRLSEPPCRTSDVVVPHDVTAWDQHVDPHGATRTDQHHTSTTTALHDVDGEPFARTSIEEGFVLCRPEHDGIPFGPEPPHVWTAVIGQRAGMKSRRATIGHDENFGHEARAKYGFHTSGTRPTEIVTHVSSRGAFGARARRIPASSGVRSRLSRLQRRHAAATFSHT